MTSAKSTGSIERNFDLSLSNKIGLIVIGGSEGGFHALKEILGNLPKYFHVPIVIVQHRFPDSKGYISTLLGHVGPLKVREAEDKEVILPNTVYVSPPDYHLLVDGPGELALSVDEKENYSRPSIDVLFESAAEIYREQALGIVLSGANHDGAKGLKKIKDFGGLAIVQEPSTARNPIMPSAAIKMTPVDYILNLEEIAPFLVQLVSRCDSTKGGASC